MKRKLTLLLVATACFLGTNAQIMLTQNFNSTSSVTSSSWVRINNSQPTGPNSWFIGNPPIFTAYNGADSAYFAANYNSTTGTGTISTWLITPTVSLTNGGVLKFATRTTSTTVNPDRLIVYMSEAAGTNVGTTPTSLGTFSTQLVSINQGLTNTGYPGAWTVYSVAVTGITGTVTGRFGFNYNVPNGGPTGANSSFIGIDAVEYSLPCSNPTLGVTSNSTGICTGNSAVISATGATTYTWMNTGQNTSSITVSPTVSTIYTLVASSIPNCNSTATIALSATLTPVLSVADVTTCPGTAATLVANGATTYSWSTGATTASIAVSPTMATTYTVTGYNGICEQTDMVSVALGTSLSINAVSSASVICSGKTLSLTSSGAETYTWMPGNLTTQNVVVNPTVTTVYTLSAASGSCMGMSTLSVNVNANPSVTITASNTNTNVCINTTITYSATGATSYSWSNGSTSNTVSLATPALAGNYSVTVIGTNTNNCSTQASNSRTVSLCTGIEDVSKSAAAVSVYPNPFANELKIAGLNGSVEFYNSLGQLVYKQKVNSGESIGTSSFSKGIYIVKLYNTDARLVSTAKVIKN